MRRKNAVSQIKEGIVFWTEKQGFLAQVARGGTIG